MTKRYAHRDFRILEPHYSAHVAALTEEGLHAKTEIAAELAFRDARIVDLERRLDAVLAALPRCIAVWDLQTNARSCAKRATRGPHDVVDGDVCGDFYCDEHAGDYTDELPWADFVREAGR